MEDLLISSLVAISWRRLTAGVRTSQCGGSPRVNSKLFQLVEHVPTLFAWKPYPYEDYGKQFATYVRLRTERSVAKANNSNSSPPTVFPP